MPPQLPSSIRSHLSLGWATSTLGGAVAETVAELARHKLQCAHASSTGGLSPLGLLAPVVCNVMLEFVVWRVQGCAKCRRDRSDGNCRCRSGSESSSWARRTLSDRGAWVSAVGASVLLDVEGAAACRIIVHQSLSFFASVHV